MSTVPVTLLIDADAVTQARKYASDRALLAELALIVTATLWRNVRRHVGKHEDDEWHLIGTYRDLRCARSRFSGILALVWYDVCAMTKSKNPSTDGIHHTFVAQIYNPETKSRLKATRLCEFPSAMDWVNNKRAWQDKKEDWRDQLNAAELAFKFMCKNVPTDIRPTQESTIGLDPETE